MAKNFRSTREFREAMLEALGTTQDKDVENEANYKSALLEALGVEHTRSDVVNFETFREKLVEGVTNYSGGGGESDFSTAEVTVIKDSSHEFILSIPNIFDNTLYSTIDSEDFESGDVLQVPLYKGSVNNIITNNKLLHITGVGNVITGPIGDVIGITGDCAITISEKN